MKLLIFRTKRCFEKAERTKNGLEKNEKNEGEEEIEGRRKEEREGNRVSNRNRKNKERAKKKERLNGMKLHVKESYLRRACIGIGSGLHGYKDKEEKACEEEKESKKRRHREKRLLCSLSSSLKRKPYR